MDAYLRRAGATWGFQGCVLVAGPDGVLLRRGYGLADVAARRELTPETKFLIGSTTKPFTAIAILQLAEDGRLDLRQPLADCLPGYPEPAASTITLHHLLCHTSGIPDLLTVPEFREHIDRAIEPEELVAYFRDLPLEFAPGERHVYSNANYVLLGLIVEAVAGQAWETYVAEQICAPLGMTATGVYDDYAARGNFATGYLTSPEGALIPAPPIHPSCGYAAGGLASTIDDLYRLDRALYGDHLLQRSSVASMLTAHSSHYGYGWTIERFGDHALAAHGGGVPGQLSLLQRWTDDSLCVVILANTVTAPIDVIATSLAAIVLGEPYEAPAIKAPIAVPLDRFAEYAGTYEIAPGEQRVIRLEAGVLTAQRGDGRQYTLLPEAVDRFYFAHEPMTTLTFWRDEAGRVRGHLLQQVFKREPAHRIR